MSWTRLNERCLVCDVCGWQANHEQPHDCRPLTTGRPYAHVSGPELTAAESAELFAADLPSDDPTLAGNRLEQLFQALGVPPCQHCAARRDWLNRAHAWLREFSLAA